jgi:hypothetical protein
VQKALDNRQVACGLFAQSDEKIANAIQALDLISAYLNVFRAMTDCGCKMQQSVRFL